MAHCPLCLNTRAVLQERSPGFGRRSDAVETLRTVYRVHCPTCTPYDIDESALFLLQHCEEVRQRAVTDLRPQGSTRHAASAAGRQPLTVELLQRYVRADDILRSCAQSAEDMD